MHDDTNSFLLFNVHRSGSQKMTNFSLKHKLQRLVELLYGLARQTICPVISCSMLLSFSDHTCLLSSVEFLWVLFSKDVL